MIGIFILLAVAMCLVIKLCKKTIKTALAVIIALVTLYCIIISVDMNRVSSFREPIFALEKYHDDLSRQTTTYLGLGYEVKIVKDLTTGETLKVEMYMFNKCIAGAIT